MTSPFANVGSGSPPTISVGGQPDYGVIMQALLASRARKQRQAENSLGLVEPGAKFSDLAPDAQKQVQKATGRKYQPDEVVSPIPLTGDEAAINRLVQGLGIEGSTLAIGLRSSLAAKIASGRTGAIANPDELQQEEKVAAGNVQTELLKQPGQQSEARARSAEAGAFESAQGKLKNVGGSTEPAALSQEELAAYQHFNNFVPSQAVADQLTGQARSAVMKEALRLAADPNSTSLAKALAPLGVTPADAIGAFALGIGSTLDTALQRKSALEIAQAKSQGDAQEIALRALYGSAEEISKRLGGAYSPTFIAKVMEGDKKSIESPAGQLVGRFVSAGYTTALTELGTKGDPASISLNQLLQVARIPQIASNEDLLSKYSNLAQSALASTLTRTFTGMDRPSEQGPQQQTWDAINGSMMKKTAGVFNKDYFLGFIPKPGGMTITPQGKEADQQAAQGRMDAVPDATKQTMRDKQIVDDALQAILGQASDSLGGKR
jgi:hypothetical protein